MSLDLNPFLEKIKKDDFCSQIRKEIIEAFEEVKDAVENNNIQDLKDFQKKTDENLDTESKEIVGAINEVFQSASNGKNVIATAITGKGIETSTTDTFQTMADNINKIQSTSSTGIQNTLNKCGSRKFKFAVFSDVHTTTDDTSNANVRFKNAILKVQELGCSFITICGDLCCYDVENELTQYKTIKDTNATIPIYEVAGNHDATQQGLDTTLWKTITGKDPYYEVIQDNEVFLFLSQANWSDDSNSKIFPIEYQNWLTSKLEEYKTKSRVFMFFHQYMPDCEGFGYRNGTTNQSYLEGSLSYFTNLINTYKNVIWFSGHSHTKFEVQTNYPNVIAYNKNGEICTLIHVPTLQEAEYFIITVYEHLVELEGYKDGTILDSIYYAIDDYFYVSPVESIILDKLTLNFANTDTQTIIATVSPTNQQSNIVWETSDSNIATVIDGVVTPVSNGTCVITARCGDKSATCDITIDIPESELYYAINTTLNGCTLSNTSTKIKNGETYISTIIEPDNTTINSVVIKMGGTDITSTAYNTLNKTIGIDIVTGNIEIIVTVDKLVTNLSLNATDITLKSTGTTYQLTATKTPSDAIGDIVWETSDSNIATVNNGLVVVTATSSGSCVITAKCNGNIATCNVTVEIIQKTIIYSQPEVTGTIPRAGGNINIVDGADGTTPKVELSQPMQQGIKYYMTCDSLKFEDGTDVNIPTDKIYFVGSSYLEDGTKYKDKIGSDYADIVGVEYPMTYGFSTLLTESQTIAYFQTISLKASSSSAVTFPTTVTLKGFEIYTYGESI